MASICGSWSHAARATSCALTTSAARSIAVETHHMREHLWRIVIARPLLQPFRLALTRRRSRRIRPALPDTPDVANVLSDWFKRQWLRDVGRLWRTLHRLAIRHSRHL
jgi:hypothetical protein